MAKSARLPASGLKLHASLDAGGRPRLTLDSVPMPQPGMERAAIARQGGFARYGSMEMKRVYLYGRLDPAETRLPAAGYGMRWSLEGWAMPPVLEQAGPERKAAMLARIADRLGDAFATSFGLEIGLEDMIDPDVLQSVAMHRTGAKVRLVMTHWRAPDARNAGL